MLKKILSVFLCLVCVFTICFISQVKSQAIFIADDTVIFGCALFVVSSIALSVGLGVASGQGSVYADTAEYILYHLPSDLYNFLMDEANYVIKNGTLTCLFTKATWDRFKNWFANTDLSTIPLSSSLGSIDSSVLLPDTSYYYGQGYSPNYNSMIVGTESPYQTLSYTFNGISVSWRPTGKLTFHLTDGTVVTYDNCFSNKDLNHQYCLGLTTPLSNGGVKLVTGLHNWNYTNNLGGSDKSYINAWQSGGGWAIAGISPGGYVTLPDGTTGSVTYDNSTHSVKIGNTTICNNVDNKDDYSKYVGLTGSFLVNTDNDVLPNKTTNSNVTDYIKDVETKPVEPAIPRNASIENDEILVLPIKSNLVDPSNPSVPLTKGQVKEREKQGLPVGTTIPTVPNMSTETGKDVGITIIAGRDVLDDTPVYNPAYPSVINPGNETISITANNDVFPTQANPGQTEAFPTEAESAIVKTGEIVSDIAKDIVTPLTPDDISKGGNRMRLPTLLLQKFPFCIPYDLYNGFSILLAEPEPPRFVIPIKSTIANIDTSFTIDFSQYEDAAKIVRWFLMAAWTVALILLTRKVIWK